MNRKIVVSVVLCFIGSVAVVLALFLISGLTKAGKGSFLRLFPSHPVKEAEWVNTGSSNYYFAGAARSTVYLGHYKDPLRILEVDLTTLDTCHRTISIPGFYSQRFWSPRMKVDSPFFYLADGAVPVIYKGDLADRKGRSVGNDSIYFRDLVPLNANTFAVKSFSSSPYQNILGRISVASPHAFFYDTILKKQVDGVFCTDGMLRYGIKTNQLVYLYYYRNEFIVMDTTLSVQYRGHTIDTTSHARITTGRIESENTITLSSPPWFVNPGCSVSNEWLWVHSATQATNETDKAFSSASVIDVYHLRSGEYKLSFYIYPFNGIKMSEFLAMDDRLIVRYNHVVRIFDIEKEYFKASSIALK